MKKILFFFFDGHYSQACYRHGPIALYPDFHCYHEQKSFPVASEISTFQ